MNRHFKWNPKQGKLVQVSSTPVKPARVELDPKVDATKVGRPFDELAAQFEQVQRLSGTLYTDDVSHSDHD